MSGNQQVSYIVAEKQLFFLLWSPADSALQCPPVRCPVPSHGTLWGGPPLSVCGLPRPGTTAASHDL